MRLFHDNSGRVRIPECDLKSEHLMTVRKLTNDVEYFSLMVDDFSGMIFIKPIQRKSDSIDHIIDTIILEENQTNERTQIINADDSGEFRSGRLNEFCKRKGIKRNLTNKSTPQHSAPVERGM